MKITPIEIRQKEFEKKLRGYDKDEVQAFLLSLSNEWERVLDETKELKMKLSHAEKEVQKLRDVESSLYKTLKTAEDTGANLVDQANKAAELHMRETQMNAEMLLNQAKSKAKGIIEQAEEEAKEIIAEVQDGVKELENNYKTLESYREQAVRDLKNLVKEIVEKLNRMDKQKSEFKMADQIKRVRDLARKSEKSIDEQALEIEVKPIKPITVDDLQANSKPEPAPVPKPEPMPEPTPEPVVEKAPQPEPEPVKVEAPVVTEEKPRKPEPRGPVSFFDEIGDE
jgi:cell division initiation protein